jgi:hypothetical protein
VHSSNTHRKRLKQYNLDRASWCRSSVVVPQRVPILKYLIFPITCELTCELSRLALARR